MLILKCQIKSNKEPILKYFAQMISFHIFFLTRPLHGIFSSNALAKWKIFFNPQPPEAFGSEILS
jgi:hypothetical protein